MSVCLHARLCATNMPACCPEGPMWVLGQYDVPSGGCCKSNMASQKSASIKTTMSFQKVGSIERPCPCGRGSLTEDQLHKKRLCWLHRLGKPLWLGSSEVQKLQPLPPEGTFTKLPSDGTGTGGPPQKLPYTTSTRCQLDSLKAQYK